MALIESIFKQATWESLKREKINIEHFEEVRTNASFNLAMAGSTIKSFDLTK